MAKPYDTRLIMMVSQMPFETQDMNQFCKLLPIAYVDGTRAAGEDFLNDGEIWWMLTARSAPLAVPGKLLVGIVEDAIRFEKADPASSYYQVQRDSIRELDLKDGIEVLAIQNNAVDSLQDLVSSGFRLDLSSHPTPLVMLHWRGSVYGPFRATREAGGTTKGGVSFSFAPSNTDLTVYQFTQEAFDKVTHAHRLNVAERVSPTAQRRSESYPLEAIQHDILLALGFERIFTSQPQKIVLESIERKLQRFAKQCLSRAKRQEFGKLLDEIDRTGRESEDAAELVGTLAQVKLGMQHQDAALDTVAKALLESGMLGEDRIRKAEHARAEKYLREQAAQLQAKAQETVKEINADIRHAQSNLKDVQARLQKEELEQRTRLDQELSSKRKEAENEIAVEHAELEQERSELKHQQRVLQKNLEQVTTELRDAGDEVVNRFLAIAPLIGSLGLTYGQQYSHKQIALERNQLECDESPFEIPSYVHNIATTQAKALEEESFFQRFKQLVEDSGFVYRTLDLQRFHLSVKCSEMTVLGGPSGTGKSSLPALYAQALIGDDQASGRPGCLMVNVNPSWMDIRDLLGHMNTLEGKYYPGETGLFQHLICAQEEHRIKENGTGIYLTCLDEMNLSQVEHYFSDFMMVLDRKHDARVIRCFSPEAVASSCRFRSYAQLHLPHGIKFVGTVNFDETTRLLSDRFLDRINLIRLVSGSLPSISSSDVTVRAKPAGRMVTLSDFNSWLVDAALPADLGSLLDSMRPLLSRIGCPLSPRVYRGICRFVASASSIMSEQVAFDVQIAQRVIPKMRGLVTRSQLDSLDELMRLMNAANTCGFEECLLLLDEVRDSAGGRVWDLEE